MADLRIVQVQALVRKAANGILTSLLAGIALVSLVVGGIGIMNIMLVTVSERRHEIGLRKAVGATNGSVLAQSFIKSMLLCLIGGLLGIATGFLVSLAMTEMVGWPVLIDGSALVTAFAFSALVGILFGIWPAWKAARMDPVTTLRTE